MKFHRTFSTAALLGFVASAALAPLNTHAANAAEVLRTLWRGQWVNYVEIGEHAVTEGDIIIGQKDAVREMAQALARGAQQTAAHSKALSIDSASRLWVRSANGVVEVPFTIEAGDATNIAGAVAEVNRSLAGVVQWVPRTTQADFVAFNLVLPNAGFCASALGRSGGRQTIIGQPDCGVGTLVHEMGHTLGLLHVQQDADSAAYLDLKIERMEPGQRGQTQSRFGTRTFNGYDYQSIMHYQRRDFGAVAGLSIFETKPAGFDIGSTLYSPGDVDALLRMYGAAPAKTTVHTNPPGLQVYIDGVLTTTPASFDWPVGSVHRMWSSTELQTKNTAQFGFGRWSHDAATPPSTQLTWQVTAGDGSIGNPITAPASTVLTANFVRLVDVATTPAISAGGTTSVTSRAAAWPNHPTLFPQLSIFDVRATPNPGYLNYATFTNGFAFNGGLGVRNNYSLRLFGDLPTQTIGQLFHTGPTIALALVGDDVADGLNVTVTPPGGTSSRTLAPQISRTTPGTWKYEITPLQDFSASVRNVVDSTSGFDNPATGEVAMPATGVRTVTINAHRELKPNLDVVPLCAGSIALSDSSPWLRSGATVSATVTPIGGAIFTGWSGSVSGTEKTQTATVGTTIPEFIATFNSVAVPLKLISINPRVIGDDPNGTTVLLRGTGFTAASRVVVAGVADVPTFIDSNTLSLKIARTQFFESTRESISVTNKLSASCGVSSEVLAIDVLAAGKSASVSLVEYYNAALDYYFLTGRAGDKAALDGFPAIWARTGNEIKLFAAANVDTQPLERHYFDKVARSGSRGSHFFTALPSDQTLLASINPTNAQLAAKPYLEGVEGFAIPKNAAGSCPAGSAPIYRAFKGAPRYVDDGNHRFSNTLAQHQDMVNRLGWTDDGVVFCGVQ